ncbi:MAG: 3'-5' exonuclease [Bacteroidota bacterium]
MYASEISKEEIDLLTVKQFGGRIIMIDTEELFEEEITRIMQHRVLGFDTETKPSFSKGKNNQVSLVQLATADEAWLIRLNRTGIPDKLKELFEDENIIKIGTGLQDDLRRLRSLIRFQARGFLELQQYAEAFHIQSKSLKKLAAIVLGVKISKSQQMSNWEAHELSPAQQVYAATDAWACYAIYFKLRDSVFLKNE